MVTGNLMTEGRVLKYDTCARGDSWRHVLHPVSGSYEAWLISRSEDASKEIGATGIIVFDFEFFIGNRCAPVTAAGSVGNHLHQFQIGLH